MQTQREVYTFSGSNSQMPLEVLQLAERQLIDWNGSGLSAMEMSHRSQDYADINNKANLDMRQLLNVPPNYKIMFMQGGASLQYSALPMNLLQENCLSNYLISGQASQRAADENRKYGNPNIVAPVQQDYYKLPPVDTWSIKPKGAYFYYTDNETVEGLEYKTIPSVGDMTLVSDMTSSLGTKEIDISKFGAIFASAQKNLGSAGVTIVIVRDDLIGAHRSYTPSMFSWKTTLDNSSIFNTAPCFAVYMTGLYVDYMNKIGGVPYLEDLAQQRSKLIYDVIDSSHGFYRGRVTHKLDRSRLNAVLHIPDNELQVKFIQQAAENGLRDLEGHLSTGGLRISMFNGMPMEGIKKLKDFMMDFIDQNE